MTGTWTFMFTHRAMASISLMQTLVPSCRAQLRALPVQPASTLSLLKICKRN